MAWMLIIVAGVLEIVWATAMKQSDAFTRPWFSGLTLAGMLGSLALLSWSMKFLPLGTAYLAWTGIGAVGTFIVGVLWLGEDASFLRFCAAALIISGVLLMKLATPS